MRFLLAAVGFVLSLQTAAAAEPSYPVAVRYWGGPMVTIETWWHAPIVVDPVATAEGIDELDPSAVHVTRDGCDESLRKRLAALVRQHPVDVSHYHGHEVSVVSKPPMALRLTVDGVTIVHWQDKSQAVANDPRAGGEPIDLLILPVTHGTPGMLASALATVDALKPRYVLPVGVFGDDSSAAKTNAWVEVAAARYEVVEVSHNTVAVGAADMDDERTTRVLQVTSKPPQPSGELEELFSKMEAAVGKSQAVFAKLSANQLNWRPPNGSHTPRWNSEHMLGRQLGFFSQIYAALDPEITAIDLNPKQMPPDYTPAHPEWDGAEEARQMRRAGDFVRRFAYLLEGVDLDKRAPGSRWTLRGLLKQMERHYGQHTANVEKKFALEGWPAE